MIAAMAPCREDFEEGEYLCQRCGCSPSDAGRIVIIKPKLVQANFTPVGKVVAGTVKGDLHDIGKTWYA